MTAPTRSVSPDQLPGETSVLDYIRALEGDRTVGYAVVAIDQHGFDLDTADLYVHRAAAEEVVQAERRLQARRPVEHRRRFAVARVELLEDAR